ncbi:hypothetical protein ZIOFF_009245 [Zingiber officinale]|uniref:Uncharacterized protein n=1 Tax=Zingiber officinale TaxID=94328 RepID=A0A8J5I2I0_ZINOF|nr:hypothetical protein ZIOFF_009245 [Zingiber officinale]
MAEPKVYTVIITVDLKSWNSTATIKWALCKLMMWFKTNSVVFDEKKNTVTVTGPFDPQHFIQQLCSLAGSFAGRRGTAVSIEGGIREYDGGPAVEYLCRVRKGGMGDLPAGDDKGETKNRVHEVRFGWLWNTPTPYELVQSQCTFQAGKPNWTSDKD